MRAGPLKVIISLMVLVVWPPLAGAMGTAYAINWPENHVGPVYVQVHEISCTPPYELTDRFMLYITWEGRTVCYPIGNTGTYVFQFYKYENTKGPMIVAGNCSSFRIRYSLVPPWI
jgi:hypothetical protein